MTANPRSSASDASEARIKSVRPSQTINPELSSEPGPLVWPPRGPSVLVSLGHDSDHSEAVNRFWIESPLKQPLGQGLGVFGLLTQGLDQRCRCGPQRADLWFGWAASGVLTHDRCRPFPGAVVVARAVPMFGEPCSNLLSRLLVHGSIGAPGDGRSHQIDHVSLGPARVTHPGGAVSPHPDGSASVGRTSLLRVAAGTWSPGSASPLLQAH